MLLSNKDIIIHIKIIEGSLHHNNFPPSDIIIINTEAAETRGGRRGAGRRRGQRHPAKEPAETDRRTGQTGRCLGNSGTLRRIDGNIMALIPSQVLRVAILLSYFSILCHYKALDMPAHQTYGGSWKFLTFIDLVRLSIIIIVIIIIIIFTGACAEALLQDDQRIMFLSLFGWTGKGAGS